MDLDRIVKCELPSHCGCGGVIEVLEDYQRHQVYELPEIKLPITEYQLMKGRCRCCCQHHVACLPEGVSYGITGARLTSMMSLLVSKYQLSRRGLQEFLEEYFHFHISLGTLFNKQRLVNTVLEEPVKGLLEVAQRKDFLHADETGHRENSRRSWMWTLGTPELAYFEVVKSRSKKVLKELLGWFEGILISDRCLAYQLIPSGNRQIGWSHLKRDFTRLSEKSEPMLSRIGKGLLVDERAIFKHWHAFKRGEMIREELIRCCEPIRRRIGEHLEKGSYTAPGLRVSRFCQNLLEHFDALWTFLFVEGIEPTNNHAERCLRPWVIWRKNYFGTRSLYGTEYVGRSASLIMTCKLQGKSSFEYLTNAIHHHFSSLPAPALLS